MVVATFVVLNHSHAQVDVLTARFRQVEHHPSQIGDVRVIKNFCFSRNDVADGVVGFDTDALLTHHVKVHPRCCEDHGQCREKDYSFGAH